MNGPFSAYLKRKYPPSIKAARFGNKACVKDSDCRSTKWSHCCCCNSSSVWPNGYTDACDSESRGSPESHGTCGKSRTDEERFCKRLTSRSHVFDVGAKSWLLPAVIAEAKRGPTPHVASHLEALLDLMTVPNQEDRPSFGELMEMIEPF